jgi:hypothetical protein
MPKFTTVSPTCRAGGKPAAWERFLAGNYIAIGWCYKTELSVNFTMNCQIAFDNTQESLTAAAAGEKSGEPA